MIIPSENWISFPDVLNNVVLSHNVQLKRSIVAGYEAAQASELVFAWNQEYQGSRERGKQETNAKFEEIARQRGIDILDPKSPDNSLDVDNSFELSGTPVPVKESDQDGTFDLNDLASWSVEEDGTSLDPEWSNEPSADPVDKAVDPDCGAERETEPKVNGENAESQMEARESVQKVRTLCSTRTRCV